MNSVVERKRPRTRQHFTILTLHTAMFRRQEISRILLFSRNLALRRVFDGSSLLLDTKRPK